LRTSYSLNPDSFIGKIPGFLLIASLFFASCKEPELGLEVQDPADVVNLLLEDGFTVKTTLERQDSVRTDELSANLIGSYVDPILGTMRASLYTQLVPNLSNINLGEGFIPDSFVLVLPYRGFYGDITKLNGLQKFSVHRLSEDLALDDLYYSNTSKAYEFQPIGESDFFVPQLTDSVRVGAGKQAPQLRIPLTNDLANEFAANPSALLSVDAFTAFFKGIYISSETFSATAGQGSILDFNLIAGARMDLFYKNNENDSLSVSFVVNESCARFTQFNHAYSQEVIDVIDNPALAAERIYCQNMSGLRPRVDFPDLKTWQNGRRILINKARLIVPVNSSAFGIYAPNPVLDLVSKDADGTLIQTPDLIIGGDYPGGIYDVANKEYVFNIARYIQGQLNGVLDDNGLFIQTTGTAVSAYRVPLNGGSHPEKPIRLELLYQVLPN